MWEWLQDVQGCVLSTWENLFIAKRSKNPVGTVICPLEQWNARWNSDLPVWIVICPFEQCPATVLTKRQNTGNLHLEPCKTIF